RTLYWLKLDMVSMLYRLLSHPLLRTEGNRDPRLHSSRTNVPQLKRLLRTVQRLQPAPRNRDPHAWVRRRPVLRQSHSIVCDSQHQHFSLALGGNRDYSGLRLMAKTVPDRVLDQRLQQQAGHHGVAKSVVHVVVSTQAVFETRALDLQIQI